MEPPISRERRPGSARGQQRQPYPIIQLSHSPSKPASLFCWIRVRDLGEKLLAAGWLHICKAASVVSAWYIKKRELRGNTPTQRDSIFLFSCADGRSEETNWPSVFSRNRQVHPSTRLCLSLHLIIPARVAHTALPDTDYCCQPASQLYYTTITT